MGRLWFMLLLLHVVVSHDVILRPPLNNALVVNGALRVACGTNSSRSRLRWYHTPSGSSKASLMNDRETATLEEYRKFGLIPGHNGSYDLYTGSVRMSHSGIYTCKVTVNHKDNQADLLEASANLIVLQSAPICETSPNMKKDYVPESEVIRMSCEVQFSGNWNPSMKWIQTSTADPTKSGSMDHIGNKSIININGDTVMSTLELTVNSSMNGISFFCLTYFQGSPYFKIPGLNTSDNVPGYYNEWTPGPLNVSYGPRNIVFRPKREVYNTEDQITCYADGNPSPDYEWKEIETDFTVSDPVLTVEMIKRSHKAIYQFRCTAKNNLSITDGVLIFTIEEESTDFLRTWAPSGGLLVIVGVLVVVLVVVLVGGFLIYRRQNTRMKNKHHLQHGSASTDDETQATANNLGTTMPTAQQSPDLLSASSNSSLAGGSSHTYSNIIEDLQTPETLSPQHEGYNELTVDGRGQTVQSPVYMGLDVRRDGHDQSSIDAGRSAYGPWDSTAAAAAEEEETPGGYGERLYGNQEPVVQSSNTAD